MGEWVKTFLFLFATENCQMLFLFASYGSRRFWTLQAIVASGIWASNTQYSGSAREVISSKPRKNNHVSELGCMLAVRVYFAPVVTSVTVATKLLFVPVVHPMLIKNRQIQGSMNVPVFWNRQQFIPTNIMWYVIN